MRAVLVVALLAAWASTASGRIVRTAHVELDIRGRQDPAMIAEALESAYLDVRARGFLLPVMVRVQCHATTGEFARRARMTRGHAAAIRGEIMHLQPVSVLMRTGSLHRTLRHEFVHLATGSVAGLPRWLAEGVAMTVAGEQITERGRFMRVELLETALSSPGPVSQTRAAYGSALRLTGALIDRYGWAAVLSLVQGGSRPTGFAERFRQLTGVRPAAWATRALAGAAKP